MTEDGILEVLEKAGVPRQSAVSIAQEIMRMQSKEQEEIKTQIDRAIAIAVRAQDVADQAINDNRKRLLQLQEHIHGTQQTWVKSTFIVAAGAVAAAAAGLLSSKEIAQFLEKTLPGLFRNIPSLIPAAWAADPVGASKMLPADIGTAVFVLIYLVLAILMGVFGGASILSKNEETRRHSIEFTKYLSAFFIGVVSGKLG